MSNPNDFSQVFADAEKQVAGIKNERLREIAFDKLVTHLLQQNTDEETAQKPKPATKTKTPPTKVRPKAKSKETISLVKDLNLRPKGKMSFKEFSDQKKPSSAMDFNAVAIHYLTRTLELSSLNPNHVYTCYKEVGRRAPEAMPQSLIDTSRLKGFRDTSDMKDIKLTTRGDNFVEHDLPPKSKK